MPSALERLISLDAPGPSWVDRVVDIAIGHPYFVSAWQGVAWAVDMATAWNTDEPEFDGFLNTIAGRTADRFMEGVFTTFGPESGLGALVGALPEPGTRFGSIRSGGGAAIHQVGEAIDVASREAIREPLATAFLSRSLSVSPTFGGDPGFAGIPRLFEADTWRTAHQMSQDISVGQAAALAVMAGDILDPGEIEQILGSEWFDITSGSLDFLAQIFGDVTVVGAKATLPLRARAINRGLHALPDTVWSNTLSQRVGDRMLRTLSPRVHQWMVHRLDEPVTVAEARHAMMQSYALRESYFTSGRVRHVTLPEGEFERARQDLLDVTRSIELDGITPERAVGQAEALSRLAGLAGVPDPGLFMPWLRGTTGGEVVELPVTLTRRRDELRRALDELEGEPAEQAGRALRDVEAQLSALGEAAQAPGRVQFLDDAVEVRNRIARDYATLRPAPSMEVSPSRWRQWVGANWRNHSDMIEAARAEAAMRITTQEAQQAAQTAARARARAGELRAQMVDADDPAAIGALRRELDDAEAQVRRGELIAQLADSDAVDLAAQATGRLTEASGRIGDVWRVEQEALAEATRLARSRGGRRAWQTRRGQPWDDIADVADQEVIDAARRRATEAAEERRRLEGEIERTMTDLADLRSAANTIDQRVIDAAAPQVARLFNDSHALDRARALLRARTPGQREAVMRVLMGDPSGMARLDAAIEALAGQTRLLDDLAARQQAIDVEAAARATAPTATQPIAELDALVALRQRLARLQETTGHPRLMYDDEAIDAMVRYELANAPEARRFLEAEADNTLRELGNYRRLRELAGSLDAEPRISRAAGAMQRIDEAGQRFLQTSIYSTHDGGAAVRMLNWSARTTIWPFTAAFRAVHYGRIRRVPPRVELTDDRIGIHAVNTLRGAGITDPEKISRWQRQITEARGHQRAELWRELVDETMTDLLARFNVPFDSDLRQRLLDTMHRGMRQADQRQPGVRRDEAFGVHRDPDSGDIIASRHPISNTQAPQFAVNPDFMGLRRELQKWQRRGWLDTDRQPPTGLLTARNVALTMLDHLNYWWKGFVLARPAWLFRVVGLDEQLRFTARFGALAVMRNLAPAVRELGGRVPARLHEAGVRVGAFGEHSHRGFATSYVAGLAGLGALTGGPAGALLGGGAAGLSLRWMNNLANLEAAGYARATVAGLRLPNERSATTSAGLQLRRQLSAGEDTQAFLRDELRDAKQRIERETNWQILDPHVDEAAHLEAWADALNNQFGRDTAGRHILSHLGEFDEDLAFLTRWATRSDEGRAYMDGMPASTRNNLESWSDEYVLTLDEYTLGFDDELVAAALRGDVTPELLASRAPTPDARPPVHGPTIQHVTQRSPGLWMLNEFISAALDTFGTLPTDALSRNRAFDEFYRTEMARRVGAGGWSAVEPPTPAQWSQARRRSREYALEQTRRLMYDMAERSELHRLLRFVFPFLPAQQEVLQRWFNLAVTQPERVAPMIAGWSSLMDNDDLIHTDPDTGEQWLTFTLPEEVDPVGFSSAFGVAWTDPLKPFRDADGNLRYRMPTGGFNTVLNFDMGTGPFVSLPVAQMARDRPDVGEALSWLFPFGIPDDWVDAVSPAWMRQLRAAYAETDAYNSTLAGIVINRVTRMRNGLEPMIDFTDRAAANEFHAEVRRQARDFHVLRAMTSATAPAPLLVEGPYQPYIDDYRAMIDAHGFEAASELFLDRYGEEFFALTSARTETANGIPPTVPAFEKYQEFREPVEAYPDIVSFVIGRDGGVDWTDGEFSSTVFDWQMAHPVAPGSDETQRRWRTPEEVALDPEIRTGWIAFSRLNDHIDAEMERLGLRSLRTAEGRPLEAGRTAAIEALAQRYPAWWREYNQRDDLAYEREREQFRGFIDWAGRHGYGNRPDVAAVRDYLAARDIMVEFLNERVADGGPRTITAVGNADLALAWDHVVAALREANPTFATIHSRYFDRDRLEATV